MLKLHGLPDAGAGDTVGHSHKSSLIRNVHTDLTL